MTTINCGKRRLVSYRYGWKIEAEKTKEKTGEKYWDEDRPAYPATLAQGFEMICERELQEHPTLTPEQLPVALRDAAGLVRKYWDEARRVA